MLLLPTVIGSWTLARKLGSDGPVDRLAATSAEGRPALARRIDADQLRDPGRLAAVAARARDILGVRHPSIVPALDLLGDGSSTVLIEEAPDAVSLDSVLAYLRSTGQALPAHVFLHIATQICNALEALHGRPSPAAGADQLLHLGLRPSAVLLSREGRVRLGRLALVPGVGSLPGADADEAYLEYLAPEQTHADQRLAPASDVFALGALLTELLTLRPLFRDQTPMKTIQRVRRAEIDDMMLEAQERLPGVEVALYRALALNPRHRYQRAFVLREDLRGLMAEFSFKTIHEEIAALAAPVFDWAGGEGDEPPAAHAAPHDEWMPLTERRLDPDRQDAVTQREDDPFALDERTDPDAAAEFEVSLPLIQALRENTIPPDDDSFDADPEDEDEEAAPQAPPTVAYEDSDTIAPAEPDAPAPAPMEEQTSPTSAVSTWPPETSVPPPATESPPPFSTPQRPHGRSSWVNENTTLPPDDDSLDLADEPNPPAASPVDPLLNAARILSAAPPPRPSFPSRPMSLEDAPTVPPVEPRSRRPITAIPVQRRPAAAAPPQPFARSENTWVPDEVPASALHSSPTPPPRPVQAPSPLVTPNEVNEAPPSTGPRWALALIAALVLVVACAGVGAWWTTHDGASGALVATAPEVGAPAPVVAPPIVEPPIVEPPIVEPPIDAAPLSAAPSAEAVVEAPVVEEPTAAATPTQAPRAPIPSPARIKPPPVIVSAPLPVPAAPAVPSALVTAQLVESARQGALNPAEVSTLEGVPLSSEEYSRSRALLVQNAEKRGDTDSALRYLDQLFKLDENRYNPVYLSRASVHLVNKQRYAEALAKANEAERYWSRIPADQMDRTQTDIYASQASAALGLFYANPDDAALLERSIRAWERYRQHAAARGDSNRVAKADAEISRLRDMQARME
jgi:serine/threonine protein kinase